MCICPMVVSQWGLNSKNNQGKTGPGHSMVVSQCSGATTKERPPVPTGTPRGRPRRVFTAASCKHTKDKHDPIRGIDHERVAKPRVSRGSLAACIGEEM